MVRRSVGGRGQDVALSDGSGRSAARAREETGTDEETGRDVQTSHRETSQSRHILGSSDLNWLLLPSFNWKIKEWGIDFGDSRFHV